MKNDATDALKIGTLHNGLVLVKNSEKDSQLFFQNFIPVQHTFLQYLGIWIYVKNGTEMDFYCIPENQVFSKSDGKIERHMSDKGKGSWKLTSY